MIAAPPGWVARFKQGHGPIPDYSREPVVAWNDEGAALIVDAKHGTLTLASNCPNFHDVKHEREPRMIAALPGDGWAVSYKGGDGGDWREPVVAWAVDEYGHAVPLTADHEGRYAAPEESENAVLIAPPAGEVNDARAEGTT